MPRLFWRDEHLWNVTVLQRVYISCLVYLLILVGQYFQISYTADLIELILMTPDVRNVTAQLIADFFLLSQFEPVDGIAHF
jgi:hypothetical protein